LDEAYNYLNGKLRSETDWEHQLLRNAYEDIEQNWPVVMLLPNGPYEMVLNSIVEELEADAAHGRLSTEQTELYDLTRGLVEALRGNTRGKEMSWRRLEADFNEVQLAREERLSFGGGRNRLN
jgi:hypothetical protein